MLKFTDLKTVRRQCQCTGVSTIASLSVTGSTFDRLTVNNFSNLSGITTIDDPILAKATVSGVVTAAQFIGAGQIGIGTSGGLVGYGVSFLQFSGFWIHNCSIQLCCWYCNSPKVVEEVVVQVLVLVQHLEMHLLVSSLLVTCGITQDLDDSSSIIKMIIAHSG